jgi:hypothetical protein
VVQTPLTEEERAAKMQAMKEKAAKLRREAEEKEKQDAWVPIKSYCNGDWVLDFYIGIMSCSISLSFWWHDTHKYVGYDMIIMVAIIYVAIVIWLQWQHHSGEREAHERAAAQRDPRGKGTNATQTRGRENQARENGERDWQWVFNISCINVSYLVCNRRIREKKSASKLRSWPIKKSGVGMEECCPVLLVWRATTLP